MNLESIRIIEELLPDLNNSSLSQQRDKNLAGNSSKFKGNKTLGNKPEPSLKFSQHLSRRSANTQKGSPATDPHALALFVFVSNISRLYA